jgi:hypothetical protein
MNLNLEETLLSTIQTITSVLSIYYVKQQHAKLAALCLCLLRIGPAKELT